MFDVVGIGSAVYDTLIITNSYPKEDTKIRAKSVIVSGGGPCATGLVAASKLGALCSYIGVLSDDIGGQFLLEDFTRYNVNTENIEIMNDYTSFSSYVLINEENATRTCVAYKGDLPPLIISQKHKEAIKNSKILMVDGNELKGAIESAEFANSVGTKVLYDAGGLYEGVQRLLPLVDILIPSEEFALAHTGEKTANQAAIKLFELYSPDVVVITQGKNGGICYDGKSCREYPSIPVEVVDSNGAGDVFHGSFAFAQVHGFDYYKSCIFSSAASAIKCTKLGARKAAPTFEEVSEFLRSEGYEF